MNETYDITGKSGKKYKGDDTIDVTADKTTVRKIPLIKTERPIDTLEQILTKQVQLGRKTLPTLMM